MAALGLEMETVSYVKPKSSRDESRLGLSGHIHEAVGSLALTGVLTRLGVAGAGVSIAGAARHWKRRPTVRWTAVAAGIALAAAAAEAERFTTRSLRPRAIGLPIWEGEASHNDHAEPFGPPE